MTFASKSSKINRQVNIRHVSETKHAGTHADTHSLTPYLCHKLWRTASGDLRLFWLWQSHTVPEARPEPPCLLLLHLPLWHHHPHHRQLLLLVLVVPSSRCCPCQHPHWHPSLHGRCKEKYDCQSQPWHHRDGEQQPGPVPLSGTCCGDE